MVIAQCFEDIDCGIVGGNLSEQGTPGVASAGDRDGSGCPPANNARNAQLPNSVDANAPARAKQGTGINITEYEHGFFRHKAETKLHLVPVRNGHQLTSGQRSHPPQEPGTDRHRSNELDNGPGQLLISHLQ
ncbi:hypothetical protein ERJ75_000865700 [Trypanosoma vivax]|nr:hypothetical protein ERJ75_000865700 [Trypanosoma vivax]